jgi:hypothetical protein
MKRYDAFTPLPVGAATRPDEIYGYGAASAGTFLSPYGVGGCDTIAAQLLHPGWPRDKKRDAGFVQSLDELSGLVDHGIVPVEAARQEVRRIVVETAGILAMAQRN